MEYFIRLSDNEVNDAKKLAKEIEQVREKLYGLAKTHSLLSHEVLELSQKLDKLIVEIQRHSQ